MNSSKTKKLTWIGLLGAVLALTASAPAAGYVSGPNGGFAVRGPGGRYVAQGPNGNYVTGRGRVRYPAPTVGVVVARPVVVARAPVVYVPSYSVVVSVQRRLKVIGYYGGAIDGVAGPATRAAIRQFQRENHLAVTGEVNPALIAFLRA
jgi:hypothetical protein